MASSPTIEELVEEASERTDVLDADLHNLEMEGELVGAGDVLCILIIFEPEVEELSTDFREWCHSNDLYIRQVRRVENRNRQHLSLVLSKDPSPEGFNEYWA